MGYVIYFSGEFQTKQELTSKQKKAIEEIPDYWNQEHAFKVDDFDTISFVSDEDESLDPIEGIIKEPLKALADYAKKQHLDIKGSVDISCNDIDDYDNITLYFDTSNPNLFELKQDVLLSEATTEMILKELEKRGINIPNDITERSL